MANDESSAEVTAPAGPLNGSMVAAECPGCGRLVVTLKGEDGSKVPHDWIAIHEHGTSRHEHDCRPDVV